MAEKFSSTVEGQSQGLLEAREARPSEMKCTRKRGVRPCEGERAVVKEKELFLSGCCSGFLWSPFSSSSFLLVMADI